MGSKAVTPLDEKINAIRSRLGSQKPRIAKLPGAMKTLLENDMPELIDALITARKELDRLKSTSQ